MSVLTAIQRSILTHAASHRGGAVLPPPDDLPVNRGAVTLVLKGLLARGLVAERPAGQRAAVWRTADDGRPVTLALTRAGRQALAAGAGEKTTVVGPATPVRSGTKQAVLVALLVREGGATLAELQAATGWLPHTVRAALTGLRKRGFAVERRADSRAYVLDSGDGQ
ncbi:MAG: DUF3489 domain-containing protein [Marinovum algicola]